MFYKKMMLFFAVSYSIYSINADIITIDDNQLFVHETQTNAVATFGAAQNITPEQYKKLFFDGARPILKFITDSTNNGYMTPEEQNKIKAAFLKIASNPIGKVLLYRILIEIRKDSVEENREIRDHNKSITFVKEEGENADIAYNELGAKIYIRFDWFDTNTDFQVVGKADGNVYHIVTEGSDDDDKAFAHSDVWLFHEMLHWYHFLHDRKTYDAYSDDGDNILETITSHDIGKIFYGKYGSSDDELKKNSAHQWLAGIDEEAKISFEEMRTILGGAVNHVNTDGDELSENAYRIYARLPMRFGHCICEYLEDKDVVEKAKDNAVAIQRLMSEPDMKWSAWRLTDKATKEDHGRLNGLGSSKISLHDD